MPVITLSRVSFAFRADTLLFQDVDLRISDGWTGLVGPNGSGKTTFLRLLDSSLAPDTGRLGFSPPGACVLVCAQRVEQLDKSIMVFSNALDGVSQRVRGELRLEPEELARWSTLSPGERKRWQVGAALAQEPEVLLLDEPTNHLDAEAKGLLRRALREFGGIGLLVSHDRDFLDGLTNRTLRCFAGRIGAYRGAYSTARSTWEREDRERDAAWDKLRGKERGLERRLQSTREKRSQEASKRRSARGSSSGVHAASSSFSSFRRRSPAISIARDMRVLHNAVNRVEGERSKFQFDRELGRGLFVDFQTSSVPVILALQTRSLRAGDHELLRDVDVQLRRESRVRLTGPNGAGKTTLLEALLASGPAPAERRLYLPQGPDEGRETKLVEELHAMGPEERGRLLTAVASLGADPEHLLSSRRLSPGEARKLLLAMGLGRRVQTLILDEPTNHMDLPSIERLETTLAAYPGALLLVSHDERFARACTDTQWAIEAGALSVRAHLE